jgi:hypothetical protein
VVFAIYPDPTFGGSLASVPFQTNSSQAITLPRLKELAHSSLSAGKIQICLVDSKPRNYDDPIRVRLRVVSLGSLVEYDALSYAWGTTISPHRTLVNGIPIPVTESLDLAFDACDSTAAAFCGSTLYVYEANNPGVRT